MNHQSDEPPPQKRIKSNVEGGGAQHPRVDTDRTEEHGAVAAPAVAGATATSAAAAIDEEGSGAHISNSSSSSTTTTATASLQPELRSVDFSSRIAWGKKHRRRRRPSHSCNEDFAADDPLALVLTPVGTAPVFTAASPALCHHVHAVSGRARACTVHLHPQPGQQQQRSSPTESRRPVPTPMFMPVGTKGCLKALTFHELTCDPALQCPIILANTYHLALQPGTELIDEMGGLHVFQGLPNIFTNEDDAGNTDHSSYNLLTDSGGFQMVSLVKLSEVAEEGVSFENPYSQQRGCGRPDLSVQSTNGVPVHATEQRNDVSDDAAQPVPRGAVLLLRPEDSIRHQNNIGANIIMALDDVISSVTVDAQRFVTATHRTLRWYDRCYHAHAKRRTQNLFPIVQGGLDTALGGLREQCLAGFRHREIDLGYITPGYAIGGLAGGEDKDDFWKVIDQCCRALPEDKPRYLMG